MLTTNQIRKVGAFHPTMGARGEWGLVGSGWSLPSSETPVVGGMFFLSSLGIGGLPAVTPLDPCPL